MNPVAADIGAFPTSLFVLLTLPIWARALDLTLKRKVHLETKREN